MKRDTIFTVIYDPVFDVWVAMRIHRDGAPVRLDTFENENDARHIGIQYGHRGFKWAVVKIGNTYELRVYGPTRDSAAQGRE